VTRAGGYNSSPWHGLSASKRSYFEDLFIYADDELLPRETALVSVTPVSLIRNYPERAITETWTLLDRQRTLFIEIESESPRAWSLQPAILGGSSEKDFEITPTEKGLKVLIKRLKELPSSYPYLNISMSTEVAWEDAQDPGRSLFTAYLTKSARVKTSKKLSIAITLTKTGWDESLSEDALVQLKKSRGERIDGRASFTRFSSNDPELDKAIFWAHNSLDALVMEQQGKGIYAGLPWFDDYWGRDAFISFSGAVLVSGQFEDARRILESFARLQNKDEFDSNYGRVPNRAQPEDIIYNTTDGTPWFVRSIWDYYRYSGDVEFLDTMWPVIRRATEGALMNWVEKDGLLNHHDADTWMDAKGPDGPWSPRGDRAIDIQFLWRDQLEITAFLAVKNGDLDFEEEVRRVLAKCSSSLKLFRSGPDGHYVDHLNADGSQDRQIRPNVFLVPTLFQETCDWKTFSMLAPELVTRQGVLSLSQLDPNFHPYHHLPRLYVQDAAYHNGIIWTWNSAATISPAIRFHQYHYAEALFNDLTDQILHRGAVGTIAELTDAWPRDGEFGLSGTFSQAWSLAEYLRSFYQDILGVQPRLENARVRLAPRLLEDMKQVTFTHAMGEDLWDISYEDTPAQFKIDIVRSEKDPVKIEVELFTGVNLTRLDLDWETRELNLSYEKQMGQWTLPDVRYSMSSSEIEVEPNSLSFCQIDTSLLVTALQGPGHRLLAPGELLNFQKLPEVLKDIRDPAGDDHGFNGRFTYPENPQFEAGLADIRRFVFIDLPVSYEFGLKFSNLVDPGWHPEYGYQLTYCAIGISYDPNTGTREVGKNSQDKWQNGFRADLILYVSGGLLLVDEHYEPLAEYMPTREDHAIGDAEKESLRFTLPRSLFPRSLEKASFQVAVGIQDDHGGAGIGDFRAVEAAGGEWTGGGGSVTGSNVYDWLIE